MEDVRGSGLNVKLSESWNVALPAPPQEQKGRRGKDSGEGLRQKKIIRGFGLSHFIYPEGNVILLFHVHLIWYTKSLLFSPF